MNNLSNSSRKSIAVILAAGMGTRMKSSIPKAMHPIAGIPMIRYLLNQVEKVFDRIVVVIGPDMEEMANLIAPHQIVIQNQRLGTAHAALQVENYFEDNIVTILNADNPLITEKTLKKLLISQEQSHHDMTLLAMECTNPKSYGRIIEDKGRVKKIVETIDATEEEKKIKLCHSGVICAEGRLLSHCLRQIDNKNAKQEYYLVDAIAIAVKEGKHVKAIRASETELTGINSKIELAFAETVVQQRLRQQAMDNGVTMLAPETVFLSFDTILEQDVIIYPHVVFGKNVIVRSDVEIKSFCHLEGCEIKQKALIGPYARIRPDSIVEANAHIGNFVELKATHLGEGVKANHLSYLGDSTIGRATNIGAGTIICNYDGVHKHKTIIGEEVFVGSDSILVSPVEIGNKSLIAAGSVITENVPANTKAFGRARQVNKPNNIIMANQKNKG